LVPHLERYTLRDDVALRDISAETRLIQLAGDAAEPFLGQSLVPQHNDRPLEQNLPGRWLETGNCQLAGDIPCFVTRGLLGPTCLLLHVGEFLAAEVVEYFRSRGAVRCDDSALDAVRIEAGVPLYGRDITADNLPQEVNRNAQAISFTKGCYLGQETVARIDALGHVNRLLVGIQCFGGEVPVAGEPLFAEGKEIGQVTSAAFSPRLQSPLALAYVRSSHAEPGTKLASPHGTAQVIALPLT
jgi:folate-binding protein YgfZ